jgi:hypothetical protein
MAGTITKGTDGVIEITGGGVPAEIPCLRSWTLNTSASFNEENTRCMKSNADGGSGVAVGWNSNILQGKGWTVEAEFFWQKDDEAAAPDIEATAVGDTVTVKLYPNDNVTGEKEFSGSAHIQSVSVPSAVGSNITQTVTLVGDGALAVADVV